MEEAIEKGEQTDGKTSELNVCLSCEIHVVVVVVIVIIFFLLLHVYYLMTTFFSVFLIDISVIHS